MSVLLKALKLGGKEVKSAFELTKKAKRKAKKTGDTFRREGAAGHFRAKTNAERRTVTLDRRKSNRDSRKNVEDGGNQRA